MKIAVIGASGKLGQYMIQHVLNAGYEVVGVCREKSVSKLDRFLDRINLLPGATNNREVIQQAVAGCGAVLTVLVPWGMANYSSGTAQAVLDFAEPEARLIFSCGWHIKRYENDTYSRKFERQVKLFGLFGKLIRMVDIDDQVEACRRIFESKTLWTVVRGSDIKEGESQGRRLWGVEHPPRLLTPESYSNPISSKKTSAGMEICSGM